MVHYLPGSVGSAGCWRAGTRPLLSRKHGVLRSIATQPSMEAKSPSGNSLHVFQALSVLPSYGYGSVSPVHPQQCRRLDVTAPASPCREPSTFLVNRGMIRLVTATYSLNFGTRHCNAARAALMTTLVNVRWKLPCCIMASPTPKADDNCIDRLTGLSISRRCNPCTPQKT